MVALETERTALQALPDVAPPETEAEVDAAAAEQSTEGAVPTTGDGAVLEPGMTASEQAFGDKPTAATGQVDGGMYLPEEYHAACIASGMSSKWDDRYFSGYTAAAQWVQPYDGADAMAFQLRPGQSASQAVKDFLTGPTIADYRVIGVASEMDELRDELGDQKFDKLFGSADSGTDGAIPMSQRLKITSAMYTLPFWDQMMEIAAGDDIAAAEAAEPAVAAGVEEAPEQLTVTSRPTPEAVGAELGVEREEDYA